MAQQKEKLNYVQLHDYGEGVQVKSTDMTVSMITEAVAVTKEALEAQKGKQVPAFIAKEFDKKHGPAWHCIVGADFGSLVTHETGCFVYFYVGKTAVLLFKQG